MHSEQHPEKERITMMQLYDLDALEQVRRDHDLAWSCQLATLQDKLGKMPLAAALEYLTLVHLENGFIEDDGSQTRYFPCIEDADDAGKRRLWAHVWPLRAKRVAVGRRGRCALDLDDLRRQQRGLQFFHRARLNGRGYNGFSNPTPFALFQTTIASENHEPQSWFDRDPQRRQAKSRVIVEDLVTLASDLKGWVALYNGMGAGATIDHLHFHAFKLPLGHGPLPVHAFAPASPAGQRARRFGGNADYPLSVFGFSGPVAAIVEQGTSLLGQWIDLDPDASTVNLVAFSEDEQTTLYCVPRNRFLEFAPGFPYRVGSMEVAGIFVYSKEKEIAELQLGRIDYRHLWQILKAVHPPLAAHLTID
jgi:hypothetical protein